MEKSFRHRLTEIEVSLIVEGLLMKLKALYKKRDDSDMVKLTYVFLKKMMYKRVGGLEKEAFSWNNIETFLNVHTGTDEI